MNSESYHSTGCLSVKHDRDDSLPEPGNCAVQMDTKESNTKTPLRAIVEEIIVLAEEVIARKDQVMQSKDNALASDNEACVNDIDAEDIWGELKFKFVYCRYFLIQVSDTEESAKWKAILIPRPALLQDDSCSTNSIVFHMSGLIFAQVNLGQLWPCS